MRAIVMAKTKIESQERKEASIEEKLLAYATQLASCGSLSLDQRIHTQVAKNEINSMWPAADDLKKNLSLMMDAQTLSYLESAIENMRYWYYGFGAREKKGVCDRLSSPNKKIQEDIKINGEIATAISNLELMLSDFSPKGFMLEAVHLFDKAVAALISLLNDHPISAPRIKLFTTETLVPAWRGLSSSIIFELVIKPLKERSVDWDESYSFYQKSTSQKIRDGFEGGGCQTELELWTIIILSLALNTSDSDFDLYLSLFPRGKDYIKKHEGKGVTSKMDYFDPRHRPVNSDHGSILNNEVHYGLGLIAYKEGWTPEEFEIFRQSYHRKCVDYKIESAQSDQGRDFLDDCFDSVNLKISLRRFKFDPLMTTSGIYYPRIHFDGYVADFFKGEKSFGSLGGDKIVRGEKNDSLKYFHFEDIASSSEENKIASQSVIVDQLTQLLFSCLDQYDDYFIDNILKIEIEKKKKIDNILKIEREKKKKNAGLVDEDLEREMKKKKAELMDEDLVRKMHTHVKINVLEKYNGSEKTMSAKEGVLFCEAHGLSDNKMKNMMAKYKKGIVIWLKEKRPVEYGHMLSEY